MKAVRMSLVIMAAALLTIGLGGMAYAFHSGGVAECEGCHSMHGPVGSYLLIGTDQSSTCLICHEHAGDTGPSSYHISTASADMGAGSTPKQRTPGGDFAWVKKTFTYTYSGSVYTEDGAGHGHNVIAADKGYVVDPNNPTAPGGTFPSSTLACNSCHDPHGQYRRLTTGTVARTGQAIWASGSYYDGTNVANNEPKTHTSGELLAVGVYRLLAGSGYTKDGITFNGVPVAKAPSTYNRTESATQTRVAYGTSAAGGHVTWGQWCATCHPGMHSTGNYVHPVDQGLGSTIAANYKTYVKSGNMTGDGINGYLSLVPFTENSADYAAIALHAVNNNSVLTGPGTSDKVDCMSCHRAHASGFEHALRFDQGYEFMVKDGAYIGSDNPAVGTTGRGPLQSRGRVIADWQAAYYDRPATMWSAYQRPLCNKCHVKD